MAVRVLVGVGLLMVGMVLGLPPRPLGAEEEAGATDAPADMSAKAIAAWGKTCQKCHAVPDPAFDTDRAFLGQIRETT